MVPPEAYERHKRYRKPDSDTPWGNTQWLAGVEQASITQIQQYHSTQ
jgi:hypothetical protein